jgi:hypothetical protein
MNKQGAHKQEASPIPHFVAAVRRPTASRTAPMASGGLPEEIVFPGSEASEWNVARRWDQLRAVLRKNRLLKQRSWKTTLAEVFSPPLFLCILWLGYNLSDIETYDAGTYAHTTINVNSIFRVLQNTPDPGTPVAEIAQENPFQQDTSSQYATYLEDVRDSLTSVLNGALPILSTELFLGIGFAVRDALGEDNLGFLTDLESYLRDFGNVLSPGDLHVSPDSAETRAFVNATLTRHPTTRRIGMCDAALAARPASRLASGLASRVASRM